jgi:hypothetical protein
VRTVAVSSGASVCVDFLREEANPSAQGGDQPKFTPAQAKALENWFYTLALQAATWGSPAVIMYNLRYNDAVGPKPKAVPNSIWRMENISTPKLSEEAG